MDDLVRVLETEMRRCNWNRSELARQLGVKPQLVSRWLDRDTPTRPSPDSCNRIATLIGVPSWEILKLAGHIRPDGLASVEYGEHLTTTAPDRVRDPEWEVMQRELKEIYDSFDRSKWSDLTATVRAVSSLVASSPKEVVSSSPKSESDVTTNRHSSKEDAPEAVNYRRAKEARILVPA